MVSPVSILSTGQKSCRMVSDMLCRQTDNCQGRGRAHAVAAQHHEQITSAHLFCGSCHEGAVCISARGPECLRDVDMPDVHVTYVLVDGQPWFAAKPLAGLLDYADTTQAIRDFVDPRHRQTANNLKGATDSSGAVVRVAAHPQTVFVDMHGCCQLILGSQKPGGRSVMEWVIKSALRCGPASFMEQLQANLGIQPMRITTGFVYIITSPLVAAVKLGKWGGTLVCSTAKPGQQIPHLLWAAAGDAHQIRGRLWSNGEADAKEVLAAQHLRRAL